MNMKPRKPIPQPKQKQVEVDLKSAETMKCAQVWQYHIYSRICDKKDICDYVTNW